MSWRPLQVYLDSSDFSRFADVLRDRGTKSDAQILQSLASLRDCGLVEFRYSYIHISECAAVDLENVDLAIEKGRAIEYLCGSKTLLPYFSLPIVEAAALLTGSTVGLPRDQPFHHGRKNDGTWYPDFLQPLSDLCSSVQVLHCDPLSAVVQSDSLFPTNRRMRRKSKRITNSGKLANVIRKDKHLLFPIVKSKFQTLLPVSDKSVSLVCHLLANMASEADIRESVARDLSDLPNVMEWLGRGEIRFFGGGENWLRQGGYRYQAVVAETQGALNELAKNHIDKASVVKSTHEASAKDHCRRVLSKLKEVAKSSIAIETDLRSAFGFTNSELTFAVESNWPNAFWSQVALAESFAQAYFIATEPSRTPRRAERARSDIGDVMHAAYLPYVDIFRADKFAAQYVRRVALRSETLVIDNLIDLPETIRKQAFQTTK